MGANLLLVEDDPRVRRGLRLALEVEGFQVAEAPDGTRGVERVRSHHPDLVLLDVMLPDTDGLAVCRQIRRHSDVPIIMVTARVESADVVAGLEAGADDYVTKPLVPKVLCARIRAHLRRTEQSGGHGPGTDGRLVLGDLDIRFDEARVLRRGEPVQLTRTEFRLLAALAAEPGAVCSREQLLDQVWGYNYFGDHRVVDVHIGRLRAKLEPDPSTPTYVVTARGLGYRLAT